jgi:hypothetical protein
MPPARGAQPLDVTKPDRSTEVTNPPVITQSFFMWVPMMHEDVVVLNGEPGAVVPGGATIEIENLRTGEVTTVVSNDDGSFRAELPGKLADGFVFTASNEKGSSDSVTVTGEEITDSAMDAGVDAGPASDGGDDSAQPELTAESAAECRSQQSQALAQVERSTSVVDRSCTVAEDCVFLRPSLATACSTSCSTQVVSRKGRDSVEMIVQSIERAVCQKFEADGCTLEGAECPAETRALSCVDGQCSAFDPTGKVTCESIYEAGEKRTMAILAAVENTCRADDDCTIATFETDCHEQCFALPLSSAGAVLSTIPMLEQVCKDYLASGCEQVVGGCTEDEPHPLCVDGRCARAPMQP